MIDDESEGSGRPTPDTGVHDEPSIPVIVEEPAGDGADAAATKLAELQAALSAAEREKKDNWDKYVRSVADFENARKRQRRELEDARADTKIKVLKEMLPVVDNLERAIEHAAAQAADTGAIFEGVRLVLRQFIHAFERLEVHPVEASGQPFDPNLHEAISQQDSDQPPGTVIAVLQKGYRVGDRLLRPAMVVVAKAREQREPGDEAPAPEPREATES